MARQSSKEAEALAKVPLFSDLNQRHLRRVVKSTQIYTFEDGTEAVTEGTPTEAFYVILDGTAKVVRRGRTVDRLGAGDFFGEVAILDAGPRTATIVADGNMRCMVLLRPEFRNIVMTEPQVGYRILRGATQRLRQLEKSLAT